jgi:predicted O-methyltransferase YrrM
MEGCPETSGIAAENFSLSGLNNITLLTGSFDELLPGIKSKGVSPGMVFIDGNHRREPLLNYFSQVADISGPDTVVIIDDIHITKEMSEAWREIKRHEKVSLSVDIFRMGMVFFRKGMPRYDYIIRY